MSAETATQSSGDVRERIIDLVDSTFDRVQPQIDGFATDERRQTGDGGLVLQPGMSTFHDVANGHGFLALRVSDRESRKAVGELFTASPIVAYAIGAARAEDKEIAANRKMKMVAGKLVLQVLRDAYPQGHTEHRWLRGDMWGDKDFDPNVWGLRHRVGASLLLAFMNPRRDRPYVWKHSVSAQARFDRPTPLFKASVSRALPVKRKNQYTKPETEYSDSQHRRDAIPADLDLFEQMFALAKNLRPSVTPIRAYERHKRAIEAIATKAGFGEDDEAEAA